MSILSKKKNRPFLYIYYTTRDPLCQIKLKFLIASKQGNEILIRSTPF